MGILRLARASYTINLCSQVLNLHQGVDLNPFINYPFDPEASAKVVNKHAHAHACIIHRRNATHVSYVW